MQMHKKAFTIKDIMPIGLLFVIVIVALSIGGEVVQDIRADQVTGAAGCNATDVSKCGYDYNTSSHGLTSFEELGSWTPTIALVAAASIILGVLIYSFIKN